MFNGAFSRSLMTHEIRVTSDGNVSRRVASVTHSSREKERSPRLLPPRVCIVIHGRSIQSSSSLCSLTCILAIPPPPSLGFVDSFCPPHHVIPYTITHISLFDRSRLLFFASVCLDDYHRYCCMRSLVVFFSFANGLPAHSNQLN